MRKVTCHRYFFDGAVSAASILPLLCLSNIYVTRKQSRGLAEFEMTSNEYQKNEREVVPHTFPQLCGGSSVGDAPADFVLCVYVV